MSLVTNGMPLTENHIASFIDNRLSEICLSVHGIRKETYESLMTKASFEKLVEVLEIVDSMKKAKKVRDRQLRINYTLNPDNLEELTDFFSVFGPYRIDTLQIRPVKNYGGIYRHLDLVTHFARYL